MYYPNQVAANYINTGKAKAALPTGKMLVLSVMAGIFVALAAVGANTVSAAFAAPAVGRIGAAMIFPAALAMVLVAGSELFTGNNLMVIPLYEKEITVSAMLRNWCIVYAGNLLGSLFIVLLLFAAGQWGSFGGAVAVTTIKTAAAKIGYGFGKALLLGIGCNFLVCTAAWMSYAADTVGGKIAAVYLPIALFVLTGFEHSVANMYYIPAGLLAAQNAGWAAQAAQAGVELSQLSIAGFVMNNLLPVTLGNIIGGALCVGTPYWYVYIRQPKK
ncbi:MAG: formate/nitrite transporter family protein [Clostridiales bacterium]|nr:formate/nitrite transporter family protein [Clostridiales bacterium]